AAQGLGERAPGPNASSGDCGPERPRPGGVSTTSPRSARMCHRV
ncbi:MAG: hypothetical protein AVDCRST_MAG20-2254, partial [uncultured Acidimicrobiales bacterium]